MSTWDWGASDVPISSVSNSNAGLQGAAADTMAHIPSANANITSSDTAVVNRMSDSSEDMIIVNTSNTVTNAITNHSSISTDHHTVDLPAGRTAANTDALMYIVVVLGFYVLAMVVLMIAYVRRENKESELSYYFTEFIKRDKFQCAKYQNQHNVKTLMASLASRRLTSLSGSGYMKYSATASESKDSISNRRDEKHSGMDRGNNDRGNNDRGNNDRGGGGGSGSPGAGAGAGLCTVVEADDDASGVSMSATSSDQCLLYSTTSTSAHGHIPTAEHDACSHPPHYTHPHLHPHTHLHPHMVDVTWNHGSGESAV